VNAMLHQLDMASPVLTRLLLVALFPLSAFDTLAHWRIAVHEARNCLGRLGPALVAARVVVELAGFACILFDWHQRPAAVVLAVFCLVNAIAYHPFWTEDGYWTAGGGRARVEFWEFLKDFSIAGGLLLYASMTGTMTATATLDAMMR
jgi:putative oxidoreductase